MRKIRFLAIMIAALSVFSTGCSGGVKYYAGETVLPEAIKRYSEEIFTENDPITETNLYYWTPDGGKYHIFRDCGSLANAKTVLSGTLEEGMAAGKSGLCKTCEKRISN